MIRRLETERLPDAEASACDLKRRVEMALRQCSTPAFRRLRILVDDGIVTLEGRVASFYHKALSVQCCQRVAGVGRVVDHVSVVG